MSIVQGSFGFPVLHPAVYHYLVTGDYLGQVTKPADIPDPQIRLLLEQVMYVLSLCIKGGFTILYRFNRWKMTMI